MLFAARVKLLMIRKREFVDGSYYHIFNRGVEKRKIFLTDKDFSRFYETLKHCLEDKRKPSKRDQKSQALKTAKSVEIVAYCLMPNHFHLLLKQNSSGGIVAFLQRVSNSYAKYFNAKYKRSGVLFEGRFKSLLVSSDEQLLHLSRYIHLNPVVSGLVNDPGAFEWSSYKEYLEPESFKLVNPSSRYILENFSEQNTYEQFVLDQVDYGKKLEELKHLNID